MSGSPSSSSSSSFGHATRTGDGTMPRNVFEYNVRDAQATQQMKVWGCNLVNVRAQAGKKVACVFDIDYTIFAPGNPDVPITPVIDLLREVYSATPAKIIILTARRLGGGAYDNFVATCNDLLKVLGVDVSRDPRFCLICRDERAYPATYDESETPDIENVPRFKREMRELVTQADLHIVLNVGDQPGDFDQGVFFEYGLWVKDGR